MTAILVLVTLVAVVSVARLGSTLAHDGLGIRPAPRSHLTDDFGSPRDS